MLAVVSERRQKAVYSTDKLPGLQRKDSLGE